MFPPSAVLASPLRLLQPAALCHGWQAHSLTVYLAVAEIDLETGSNNNNENNSSSFPPGWDVVEEISDGEIQGLRNEPYTQVSVVLNSWMEKIQMFDSVLGLDGEKPKPPLLLRLIPFTDTVSADWIDSVPEYF